MCIAANPEQLLKSKIGTTITQIPVVWDQTIVLPQSEIGELALIAKRSGKV